MCVCVCVCVCLQACVCTHRYVHLLGVTLMEVTEQGQGPEEGRGREACNLTEMEGRAPEGGQTRL